MTSNDVLRSVRYMLNISDHKILEIIILGGGGVSLKDADITAYLRKEEEEGYKVCDDLTMNYFLNGLIYFKRGKDNSRPTPPLETPMTNNIVLKKLRVAFELKDEDIISLLTGLGQKVGKTELSALFRKTNHAHYRPCGDQFLRNFLKGLTARIRK